MTRRRTPAPPRRGAPRFPRCAWAALLAAASCGPSFAPVDWTLAKAPRVRGEKQSVLLDEVTEMWMEAARPPAKTGRAVVRRRGTRLILDADGFGHAQISEWFRASESRIRRMHVRVVPEKGAPRALAKGETVTRSFDRTQFLSDTLVRVARPVRVEPGDVIQYDTELEYDDPRLLPGWSPAWRSAAERTRLYVMGAPLEHRATFYSNGVAAPITAKEETRADGSRWFRYDLNSIPALYREPYAPRERALRPHVHVAFLAYAGVAFEGFRDWRAFARWHDQMHAPALRADASVGAAAQKLFAGAATPQEKLRRAFDFVVRKVRYQSIELGMNGFTPRLPSATLKNGYGDCKDKAVLLIALLAAGGVRGYPVFLGTRGETILRPAAPSLGFANHEIAAFDLPAGRVYVDPTTKAGDTNDLRSDDQGRPAFVLKGNGEFEWVTLPVSRPGDNVVDLQLDLTLGAGGDATGTMRATVRGPLAHRWRSALLFRTERERKKLMRGLLGGNEDHPSFEHEHLDAFDRPLILRGPYAARGAATVAGALLLLRPSDLSAPPIPDLPPLRRTQPLVFDPPATYRLRVNAKLPPGHTIAELPADAKVESAHGALRTSARAEGKTGLVTQIEWTQHVHEATPSDYESLRTFFDDARRVLLRAVPLKRGDAG